MAKRKDESRITELSWFARGNSASQGFALAALSGWVIFYGFGVIAQLVERLNGIEEVWGSNPHGSKRSLEHRFNLPEA